MKNILIVYDNKANATILLGVLGKDYSIGATLNFKEVTKGEDALEAIKEELPDLILIDTFTEGMSSRDVCEQIKDDEKLKHIPVTYLTADFYANTDNLMPESYPAYMLRDKIRADLITTPTKYPNF